MTLNEWIAAHPIPKDFVFKPVVHHNEDGKQIDFYWENESHYSEPVYDKDGLWIGDRHIGQETGKVIGVSVFETKAVRFVKK